MEFGRHFAEDTSRILKGEGAPNTTIFRRSVLTILKRYTEEKLSLRAKRLTASWNSENLLRCLTGNQA
ncbi:MAG TPA: hypothetical protein DIW81_11915 [Planctomycetaceae bacterium]|nr:hypothetical protein [Planctomycetaceae bacterium]